VPLLPGDSEPGEGRGVWVGAERGGGKAGFGQAERKGKREINRKGGEVSPPEKYNVHWARLTSNFRIADIGDQISEIRGQDVGQDVRQ
jgi:general stress protein YciG